jgi:hypothetical protein
VLLAGDGIDSVAAWPPDDPLSVDLAALVGRPVSGSSTFWEAVTTERLLSDEASGTLVMPDGRVADDDRTWIVAPLVARTVVFGAVLVTSASDGSLPDHGAALVQDVAERVARALFNCEEVAGNSGPGDDGLPVAIRDRLGAVAVVLATLDGLSRPALTPEQERHYQLIERQAEELRSAVQRFLAGR